MLAFVAGYDGDKKSGLLTALKYVILDETCNIFTWSLFFLIQLVTLLVSGA